MCGDERERVNQRRHSSEGRREEEKKKRQEKKRSLKDRKIRPRYERLSEALNSLPDVQSSVNSSTLRTLAQATAPVSGR